MNFAKSVAALVIIFAATTLGGHNVYAEETPKADVTLAVAEIQKETPKQAEPVDVTVQAGDTLTKIAEANGTTVDVIVAANGIADPNLVEPGQVLKITKDAQKLTDFYGSLKAAAEAFIEPPAPVSVAVTQSTTTRSTRAVTVSTNSTSYNTGNGMWCTDYVHSRRPDVPIYGNAGYNWISAAQAQGRATGTSPQAGAIAVMSGHVAYVESVNADGTYVVSEMGWNYRAGNFNQRTVGPGAFGGFIY